MADDGADNSGDEGEMQSSSVKYIPGDTTVAQEFPRRYVFILPADVEHSGLRLCELRHPRHKEVTKFLLGQRAITGSAVLLEVNEQRHHFGETWFIGNHVEPAGGLYVATPVDFTFMAIAAAKAGGALSDKFVSSWDILQKDALVARAPPELQKCIAACLLNVCDIKRFGDDEVYYRFSDDSFKEWIRKKHAYLVGEGSLSAALLLGDDDDTSKSTILREKALLLLSEYLEPSLAALAATACGVTFANTAAPASQFTTNTKPIAAPREDVADAPVAKKPRVDTSKSASVRRLEKAGAPKNTPTLFAMFAKKREQDEKKTSDTA